MVGLASCMGVRGCGPEQVADTHPALLGDAWATLCPLVFSWLGKISMYQCLLLLMKNTRVEYGVMELRVSVLKLNNTPSLDTAFLTESNTESLLGLWGA